MKDDFDDMIFKIPEEIDDDYSDDDLYNITSWGADLSFRELITMYDDNDLVKPEMQRNYVWDKAEASRFVESILMGLPIPSIFLAKTKDEKKLIVDGYQRIMTIYDYVKGIFRSNNRTFKLSNSKKINSRWRNKAFQELSDRDQRKIKTTTIHSIIFEQIHPNDNDTSMYQVFERINTSGRTLIPQEIRNCVYQGHFNTLLLKLNKYKNWRLLFGRSEEDSRMRDVEFILRYFALRADYIRKRKTGQISLKKYLNDYMGYITKLDCRVSDDLELDFKNVIDSIHSNFGVTAFKNISNDGETIKKFHPTIFDAITIATDFVIKNKISIDTTNICDRRKKLLKDERFIEATTIHTTKIENINLRISIAAEYLYGAKYE